MHAEPARDVPHEAATPAADQPQLRTLLLTDLCDSTALVERLGDGAAATLFRAHDRLVLDLQERWRGRLIDRSDGLLLLFERPIDGLGFALDYTRGLRALGKEHDATLQARAGLHVGEVLTWRNSAAAVAVGAKPLEVEGLAKPMAGRLMMLARPGQLLVSAVAEPLARRAARELGERGEHLLWKSWGRWRFKGVPEAQEIYEVGEAGVAPLRAPKSSAKAWRDLPLWRRPAALAAEALLLVGIATGAWFVTRPQPAIAFAERDWVVVADLRNLTGDQLLDDSLEQAFRISLEQSRYVNVLSDLKARDTLARMQRKPGTPIDRAVASEIALRDGARAVILPTVAEIGGKVRVSAEVIDPRTQTTVYAESADGSGARSALDSIDAVTAALRGKLGEALESIEHSSAPLPQVSTGNLDALRAYALGVEAYARGEDATPFYQRAIELDPQFALAHLGLVRSAVSQGEVADARSHLNVALKLRGHLTPRDALYLDAWAAEFNPRAASLAPPKWKLLAATYPDYYPAHANYAISQQFAGRYDEAFTAAKAASAPQNPLRSAALELVARVELARGHEQAALDYFKQAEGEGRPPNRQHAAALASLGKFDEARRLLDRMPATDPFPSYERIALALDTGRWNEAARVAEESAKAVVDSDPLVRHLFAVRRLAVETLLRRTAPFAEYSTLVAADQDATAAGYAADRVLGRLIAMYLAQRGGHGAAARKFLPELAKDVSVVGDPRAEQMLRLVRANDRRLSGDAAGAITELEKMVDDSALYQVHVALRDALAAHGDDAAALREDAWLVAHRGLAYAEPVAGYVLQALNVADSRLAQLDAAERHARAGQAKEAARELARLRRAWPEAGLPPYLRRRLEATFPASKQ
ncbi:MAG TPA: putative peptide modification system cyclase [Xanthomonadaceae bacterium]|nr:putative peptide modification system cyclase [Xanthomonadaceae bacterium]